MARKNTGTITASVTLCLVLAIGCRGLAPSTTSAPMPGETTQQSVVRGCLESCREHDYAYLAYYALGMAFSGTTAAAGTSGVLSATLADEPGADIALAATSAGSGILTVVFNWLAGEEAERYEDCVAQCRGDEP